MDTLLLVTLAQRKHDGDCGTTEHVVAVSRGDEEVSHSYCSTHPMAGPVRPHAVTNLRLDGVTVRWEWSENAFDKASPGAFFARQLEAEPGGGLAVPLAWAGEVVRTPKEIQRPVMPAGCTAVPGLAEDKAAYGSPSASPRVNADTRANLLAKYTFPKLDPALAQQPSPTRFSGLLRGDAGDTIGPPPLSNVAAAAGNVVARHECWNEHGNDHVKVVVSHATSGSSLEWLGTSYAESQSIRGLQTRAADQPGFVWVEFVYDVSENGDGHAWNKALLVTLKEGKLAWVPC
jgi:hypothetical protein